MDERMMRAMPTHMSMNRISGMIILRQGWVDGFLLSQERQWGNESYFGDDNSQARLG
jgi:hypothetical protein